MARPTFLNFALLFATLTKRGGTEVANVAHFSSGGTKNERPQVVLCLSTWLTKAFALIRECPTVY